MILSKLRGTTWYIRKRGVIMDEIVDKVKELTDKLDKGVEEILTRCQSFIVILSTTLF